MPATNSVNDETERRRAVMAICAEAGAAELQRAVSQCGAPAAEDIRAPETGLVMVRGRTGGDGAAFNIGEASVTRVAVTLGGQTGFAYQLGRNVAKARNAAVLDALWQSPAHRAAVEAAVQKIAERQAAERAERERQTAATRVNFFTMLRGED